MECDSMHSAIESAHKHLEVYSMHEWVNVLKSARRHNPYSVMVIDHSQFYDLKHLASRIISNRKRTTEGEHLNWLEMRWLRVQKSMPNTVLFKTDFEQAKFSVMKQKRVVRMPKLRAAYQQPLPISAAKYADLQSMISNGIIPPEYTQFYATLPNNDRVTDCTPESGDDE